MRTNRFGRRAAGGKKATPAETAGVALAGADQSWSTIRLARRCAIDIRSRDADIGKLAVT
jgi:hypothetical protein